MSSVGRTSCDLQVLDSAIVERIEEAVEKAKVTLTHDPTGCNPGTPQLANDDPHHPLSITLLGEEEHQESPCYSQASPPLQGECFLPDAL